MKFRIPEFCFTEYDINLTLVTLLPDDREAADKVTTERDQALFVSRPSGETER